MIDSILTPFMIISLETKLFSSPTPENSIRDAKAPIDQYMMKLEDN